MKMFNGARLARAAAIVAAGLVSATPAVTYAETPADMFVVARNTSEVTSFDPAEVFNAVGNGLLANVYDRLVMFEPDDLETIVGGAAESYAISDDGGSITFRLRPDQVFASGNPLTADDVKYSLSRAVKLNLTPSFLLTQFGWNKDNVDDAIVVHDDQTVEVRILSHLAALLALNALTTNVAAIVDSKTLMENEVDGDLGHAYASRETAGSGPYKLDDWIEGELISLEINPNHRRPEPAMKRIVLRHVPESSVQRLLLEKGDVDAAMDLTSDQLEGLKGVDGVEITNFGTGQQMYLAFNMGDETVQNHDLRRAIQSLIDYDGLAESLLSGTWIVHQTFWPSGLWGSYTERGHEFDPESAKALIESAGLTGTELRLDTLNESPFREIAESIQGNMEAAGLDVEIAVKDGDTFWPYYRSRRHQVLLAGWAPDFADPHSNADAFAHNPDNSLEAQLTGKLTWRNDWPAEDATATTNQAAAETDPEKRLELYIELQKSLQEDSPFTFLFQQLGHVAHGDDVNGFVNGVTADQTFYWTVTKE